MVLCAWEINLAYAKKGPRHSLPGEGQLINTNVVRLIPYSFEIKTRAFPMTRETDLLERGKSGGEGGIPSRHPEKFPVVMVKHNFFAVNEPIVEKPFCQCHWEI